MTENHPWAGYRYGFDRELAEILGEDNHKVKDVFDCILEDFCKNWDDFPRGESFAFVWDDPLRRIGPIRVLISPQDQIVIFNLLTPELEEETRAALAAVKHAKHQHLH